MEGEWILEVGAAKGKTVASGSVFGPEWWREEAGIWRMEATGRSVMEEEVSKVEEVLVFEGFVFKK